MGVPSVIVAYISPGEVASRFADSLAGLYRYDAAGARNIVGTISLRSGPRVAEARSQVVDAFGVHESDAEWLLMLDADMVFEPTLLEQLLEHADERLVPVLGGLCFAGVHGGKVYPTLYKLWNEDDGHVAIEPVDEYPPDALVKVGATGAACLLVHRSVYQALRRPGPPAGEAFDRRIHGFGTLANGAPNAFPWFSEGLTTSKGIPLGEDVSFCRKLMYLSIPIYVHTGIRLGHCKEWVLTADSHDDYTRERDRPANVLTAAMRVLRESGRFGPDDLAALERYVRPRYSLLGYQERPAPEPFLLPEPIPMPA